MASDQLWARGGTLLGQLQRGRGAGAIEARQAPRGDAQSALFHCLTHDPRWDPQLEERDGYYASIIAALGIATSELAAIFTDVTREARDPHGGRLVSDVLGRLALRGREDALSALRAHAASGPGWASAFATLALLAEEGVDDALDAELFRAWMVRFDGEALDRAIDLLPTECHLYTGEIPRLGAAVRSIVRRESERPRPHLDEAHSTAELLALVGPGTASYVASLLSTRRTEADRALLRRAAETGRLEAQHAALRALGAQDCPDLIDVAETRLRALADHGPSDLAAPWLRYLALLSPAHTVARARQWLREPRPLSTAAGTVLSAHATAEDFELLATTLEQAIETHDMFRAMHCLEAVARLALPEAGPLLALAYGETVYSRARIPAARGLTAVYGGHALVDEGLWDAEPEVRAISCQSARAQRAPVQARLLELEHDPFESPSVRDTARRRRP